MKKRFLTLIFTISAMLLCIFGLSACGKVDFKVNFVVDGEVYATLNTNGEEVIKMPENPTKDDYVFDGWYWDKDTWQTPFTANSLLDAPLSSDMNVYAKFTKKHEHNYTATVTEPTCTEKGYTTYTCDCGDNYKDNYVNELGHEFINYVSDNNATYDSDGTKTAYCTHGCGTTDIIPDTGTKLQSGVVFKTLSVDNELTVYGKVPNKQATFSFINEVEIKGNATFVVSTDIYGIQQIPTKTVPLEIGDNTFYITETVGNNIRLFTVTVRRRPMYTVSFETEGGTAVQSQRVEEDSLATAPETIPVKDGYTFEKWNYDFSQSVTGNLRITAKWKAKTDTKYCVEYYLQNLENDYYTLQTSETENLTGTTDTIATADIKTFPHFTYKAGLTESGNINGDGSTVLKVYYTRDTYIVTFNGNGGTRVSGWESQTVKYGGSVTAPEYVKTGYTFNYDKTNFTNISESFTATAIWTANTNTPYTVEYYLQNLQDDNYTLEKTENLTGTTDTTATAEIKTFAHFTHKTGFSESGNINGNGSTVLKVYYTRDTYTVTFNGNGGTLTSGLERQTVKYGGSVTAPTYTRTGYTFNGYDKTDYTNISENFTVTAKWTINQYTLTIVYDNGQGNKVVTQDYNTPIESIANPESRAGYDFIGWDKTIPTSMPAENLTVTAKWNAIFSLSGSRVTRLTDYGKNNYTELSIPSKIDGVTITAIASSAFSGCDSLTGVEIPSSVTSIGDSAFSGCSSLESITIPFVGAVAGKTASNRYQYPFGYIFGTSRYTGGTATYQDYYGDSTSLPTHTEYYIPSSLRKVTVTGGNILYGAFSDCSRLTSVTIGDGVTSIGPFAFKNCSSLTSITIPNSVTSIDSYAFYNCSNLTSVTIPNSVTSIGEDAFSDCSSLTSITIPNSVTSIGAGAFFGCRRLTSIAVDVNNQAYKSIDGNLYTKDGKTLIQYAIGKSATTFVIPNDVTNIGNYAFSFCSSLTSVTIPDSVTSIGARVFLDCSSLTSVTIPDSVTSIGERAFSGCSSLTSVMIGNSVTSIGSSAFSGCSSLTSITIPNSVTSIGYEAFSYCSSLTSVTIGNSVTSIGALAFYNCSSLTSITFSDTTTWYRTMNSMDWQNNSGGTQTSVTNSSQNATYFKSTYDDYFWYKK